MADMNHTVLTRLSITTTDSNQSTPTLTVPSGASLVVGGVAALSGTVALSGNVTMSSRVTASGGLEIGSTNQRAITRVSSATTAFDWGSVSANSFLEQEFIAPGATPLSQVLVQVEDSKFSGTYRSLLFDARPSATTDQILVKASNVSAAAINPDSLAFRLTSITFA